MSYIPRALCPMSCPLYAHRNTFPPIPDCVECRRRSARGFGARKKSIASRAPSGSQKGRR